MADLYIRNIGQCGLYHVCESRGELTFVYVKSLEREETVLTVHNVMGGGYHASL